MLAGVDPRDLIAAGSINGAAGTFRVQWNCGTLVRNAAGNYSFSLVQPVDEAQSIALLSYRTALPALPVAASIRDRESYGALAAPGTNLSAQIAGGAAVNDPGPWTMPAPGRTVQIVLGAGGVATSYTVTGEGMDGTAGVTDVVAAAAAGTFQGTVAFRRIMGFTSVADPVGTTDLQIGNGFGVAGDVDAFIDLIVTGALDATATMTAATGTVIPSAALIPDGIRDFDVLFSRPPDRGVAPELRLVHTTDTVKQIVVGLGNVDADVDFGIYRVVMF